jgi:hypothetical protein
MRAQVAQRILSALVVAVDLTLDPALPLWMRQSDPLRLKYANGMFLPKLLDKTDPTIPI